MVVFMASLFLTDVHSVPLHVTHHCLSDTLVESLLTTLPYTHQFYTESILLRCDCLDFVHTD